MKRPIIICAMLALTCIAHAQTPGANESSWESNDNNAHSTVNKQESKFEQTRISLREGEVIFAGLPTLQGNVWAIVTNSEGNFVKKMKISPQDNVLDVHSLHQGSLYFITIMRKNKSEKAFTLNP